MAPDVALSQALAYARDLKAVCEVWQERERELKHVNARLRASHRQSLRYAADLKKTYWRMERGFLNSLLALANALEARDRYTRGHSERVATTARGLAVASGLTSPAAETVAQAGRLHDLGKIGTREGVTNKEGPLTPEEFEHVKQHVIIGAQILAPLTHLGDVVSMVRSHHERWDGTGYPEGMRGDEIPIGGRVIAAAEVFDALTTSRPYQDKMTPEQAIERLADLSGTVLDPKVYDALTRIVSRRGTLIFLDEDAGTAL
jgi:putative nucleotidyltransferase with HDIG domain